MGVKVCVFQWRFLGKYIIKLPIFLAAFLMVSSSYVYAGSGCSGDDDPLQGAPTAPNAYNPLPDLNEPSPPVPDSFPDEIPPGSSTPLSFNGGCPPFTWSAVGTGFHFGSSTTTTSSNTLFSDSNSCGSVEIKVTDSCGNIISKFIRSQAGGWVQIANQYDNADCVIPGPPTDPDTPNSRIEGKYWMIAQAAARGFAWDCPDCSDMHQDCITGLEDSICESYNVNGSIASSSGGCCTYWAYCTNCPSGFSDPMYACTGQIVTSLYEWVCY